jgi:hypothetical protein
MWLMAHHPLAIRSNEADAPSPAVKERLFITSVEVIEFSFLLERNENTSKWGWLFRTYMQWHAVAFVLSELCVRPSGPSYERAWKAVESVFDKRILEPTSKQKGMLWKPLKQLWTRAKAIRDKRPKGNAWDGIPAQIPDFPRAFDPNGSMPTVPAPPSDRNELKPGQFHLGVIHNTAQALGLDLEDYQEDGADNDLMRQPPQAMDFEMNPDGPDAIPQVDPMVQNWLSNEDVAGLQTNNDFLRWSGWQPGPGDFALGADPMASFPIMTPDLMGQGAQEWY